MANWLQALGQGLSVGGQTYRQRTLEDQELERQQELLELQKAREMRDAEAQRIGLALQEQGLNLNRQQQEWQQNWQQGNAIREHMAGQYISPAQATAARASGIDWALEDEEPRLASTPFQMGASGQVERGQFDPGARGGTRVTMPLRDEMALAAGRQQLVGADQRQAAVNFIRSPQFDQLSLVERDKVYQLAGLGNAPKSLEEEASERQDANRLRMREIGAMYPENRYAARPDPKVQAWDDMYELHLKALINPVAMMVNNNSLRDPAKIAQYQQQVMVAARRETEKRLGPRPGGDVGPPLPADLDGGEQPEFTLPGGRGFSVVKR